jgi:hypothetical protein
MKVMEQRAKALSCKVGVLVLLSFLILVLGPKAAHKERKNRLGWVGLISRVSSHSEQQEREQVAVAETNNLGISGPGPARLLCYLIRFSATSAAW